MLPPPVINTGHPTFSVTYWCSSNFVFKCVSVCICVCAGTHRGQKRSSDPLGMELQMFVNCLTWVLGL